MTPSDKHPLIRWAHDRGISRAQLADRLGVTTITLGNWTCGRYAPTLPHAIAIEDLTNGHVTARSWLPRRK